MSRPLWCDHAKLRQMAPQRVDRLRPLAYQKIARTEQHPSGLLLFRLHGHEAHGRALCCLGGRLRVGHIVLLTLDEWLHVYRRNQLDFVPELLGLSAPMVSAPAGLHCHHAGRLRGEKIEHFPAAQLFAECDGSVCPRTMHLEAVLRQIDPDDASLIHGCLFPFSWH